MQKFLTRVVLKHYKSIAGCDVKLPPLCFLVGRNGAGKSNFLDAIRLVSDALNTSLDHALRDRSGIKEVRRRSAGHPTHFGIRLEFNLPNDRCGHYEFRVRAKPEGDFEVQNEECRIYPPNTTLDTEEIYFSLEKGVVKSSSINTPPTAKADRLYLANLSGFEEFRPLYDTFSRMGFYNLNPDKIRTEQSPDIGIVLKRDGANLASVLDNMRKNAPQAKKKVEEYLSMVVPDIRAVNSKSVLSKETLEFLQRTKGTKNPWSFLASNMSDGTLRALGILVALFQSASIKENPTPLIGIEEPESALHPAAAGVLLDALRAASQHTQVIVTSHSPDLLDDKDIPSDSILSVINEGGVTKIAPIDSAGRSAIRNGLYTPGELLRMDQLELDLGEIKNQDDINDDHFSNRTQ